MTNKEQTYGVWSGIALLLGGILASLIEKQGSYQLVQPLANFGLWLRELSLSGTAGNMQAWAIVIGISALPALGLLWKKRRIADLLLLLSSAELFAALYFLVNPTLVLSPVLGTDAFSGSKMWGLVSFGCVLATLLCWALLRLLWNLNQKPAHLLPVLLLWAAVIYAFLLGFSTTQNVLSSMASVAAGNTAASRVSTSNSLLIVLSILELAPNLLAVWAILLGGKLAAALDAAPFAETTVTLAETIAQKCTQMVRVSLLLTVAGNLLQLLLFPYAAEINVKLHLPLITLVLCTVLTLLCHYFRKAKDVSDDNATII